jgi:hypothetical protein
MAKNFVEKRVITKFVKVFPLESMVEPTHMWQSRVENVHYSGSQLKNALEEWYYFCVFRNFQI